ncbi:hypothetical protein PTT72_24825 [Serratia ureilytica]
MAILGQLTPRLEVYSIDECFCDLTGIPAAQLESLGRRLRFPGLWPGGGAAFQWW